MSLIRYPGLRRFKAGVLTFDCAASIQQNDVDNGLRYGEESAIVPCAVSLQWEGWQYRVAAEGWPWTRLMVGLLGAHGAWRVLLARLGTKDVDWYESTDQMRGLYFPGASKLVQLLDGLSRRPRWPRRDMPLPVVYLRRPTGVVDPIDALINRPATIRGKRVAFARVNGGDIRASGGDHAGAVSSIQTLRPLLDDAVAQLAGKVRGTAPLRFPHYALAVWLLDLKIPSDIKAEDEERVIASEFRKHVRGRIHINAEDGDWDITRDFPWWIRMVITLAPRIGLALTTLLWRPAGWIGRQPIGGRSGHALYRLARRFVKEKLADKYPDAVGNLLVRAFLEDLRRAYRRWTLWGAGRRRTGYPWLLIDGASDATAGRYLIDAIGRARNATDDDAHGRTSWRAHNLDRIDPLLVVAAGEDDQPADDHTPHPADAPAGYREWLNHLARSGNWILSFNTDASHQAPGEAGELSQLGPLRLRRAVAAPLVLALLAMALVAVPFVNHARCDAGWSPSLRSPLVRINADCVGVSDDPLRDFLPDAGPNKVPDDIRPALTNVYSTIMATNAQAAARADAVTIVYLGVLTPSTSNSYNALVEELRGASIAQNTSAIPIKILLANGGEGPGGQGMIAGGQAADKIIQLAADDPRLIAVAGLSISTDGAKTAIKRLGDYGLPVIGSLTSADDMATINQYYHQVGPNNLREAQVAALYASHQLHVTRVSIFYSGDKTDRYSQTLAEDAKQAFKGSGIQVDQYKSYRVNPGDEGLPPASLGAGACPDPVNTSPPASAVFYAGRAQYLEDFLNGMNTKCVDHTPPVIADDSVTRFILDGKKSGFPNVRLDYLSFANPAAWTDCAKVPFYKEYFDAFGGTCGTLTDGRAAAGYDSIQILAEGVRQVRQQNSAAPVRAGLLAGIGSIRPDHPLQGATGIIAFGTNTGVPVNKAILVLQATDKTSTPLMLCGDLPFKTDLVQGLLQDSDCPHDTQ